MQFGLLGSLGARDDTGRELEIRGPRLRLLLAALLTRHGTVVSRDALLEAVWGDDPPPSAKHGLDVLVSHLRSQLAGADLSTRPGGYVLLLGPDDLDVQRFERGLAAARAAIARGEPARAAAALRRALAEWRGPAYGDLACAPFAVEEAMRLDALRCAALEELYELELRRGRHHEVQPELESFVEANPLREQARSSLMLALYRGGRQADALAAYRRGLQLLEEQGLAPSDELRLLHRAILRHDPRLLESTRPGEPARPLTRYARNGEAAIAFQVTGEGPFDVVYAPPFITNVELIWEVPTWAALLHRLGSFSRLIRFDKRGTGMSDRSDGADPATLAEDLRAVMDAAGSAEAAVIGASDAGTLAIRFAAMHPERVFALVLWAATPRVRRAPDYPCGATDEELAAAVRRDERIWTEPGYAERLARELGAADVEELASMWKQSASPGAVTMLERRHLAEDVRDLLPGIEVPVLVLCREGDNGVTAGSRFLAEHLPNARQVVFPGSEHVLVGASRDYEEITATIAEFLGEAWSRRSATPVVSGRQPFS